MEFGGGKRKLIVRIIFEGGKVFLKKNIIWCLVLKNKELRSSW